MGKTASSLFLGCFYRILFILADIIMMTCMRAWMSSKFGRIRPRTMELAALKGMKKIP